MNEADYEYLKKQYVLENKLLKEQVASLQAANESLSKRLKDKELKVTNSREYEGKLVELRELINKQIGKEECSYCKYGD